MSEKKRAWIPGDEGRQGKPIEYDGQNFDFREVPRSAIRTYAHESRVLQGKQRQLSREQDAEIKVLEKQEKTRADLAKEEPQPVVLPDDRQDYYDEQADLLADEAGESQDKLLVQGIIGWDLPHEFSKELLVQFAKVDKAALCESICSRSLSGYDTAKK